MPLQTHELFKLIADDLTAFAPAVKGVFSRARDPFEVIELLGESPGKFRVILLWTGEDIAGDSRRSGVVETKFSVTVSHNRGLGIVQGGNLTVGRGTEPPLQELLGLVRERLRSLVLPDVTTARLLEYIGCEPVKYEGAPLDAYELRFATFAALPFAEPRI